MSEFKYRSGCTEYQNWYGCVTDFGNLRTYTLCKFELKIEWFLTIDLLRKIITILVKFRGGKLHIGVNYGRYENIAHGDRLCKHCNSGE